MNSEIVCFKHPNKKAVFVCTYSECQETHICLLCTPFHNSSHLSRFLTISETFDDEQSLFNIVKNKQNEVIKKLSEIMKDNKNAIESLINELETSFESVIRETIKMLNDFKAKCINDLKNSFSKVVSVENDKIEQIFEDLKQVKLESETDIRSIIKKVQVLEDDLLPSTSKIINETKPVDLNQFKFNYEILPKDFSKKCIFAISELLNAFNKNGFHYLSSLIQNPDLFKITDFESDLIVSSDIKLKADIINKYNRVVVENGGVLSVDPWNGHNGGRLIILSKSFIIKANGRINIDGCGYKGGLNAGQGSEDQSFSGESLNGAGIKSMEPNNGGGGGGPMSGQYGSIGGGGGGYGTQGSNSEPNTHSGNRAGGKGGITYGDEEMSIVYMGSGGGGGAPYSNGGNKAKGGNGGGAIVILTMSFINEGIISADGEKGEDSLANTYGSSGGGGSGGSIYVVAKSIDKQGELSVKGGKGGNLINSSSPGTSSKGGDGGFGRIKISDFAKLSNVEIMGLKF